MTIKQLNTCWSQNGHLGNMIQPTDVMPAFVTFLISTVRLIHGIPVIELAYNCDPLLCVYTWRCIKPFFISEYFDRWVCETACQVGENAISDRLFSALCTHRMKVAFTGWHRVTMASLAARDVKNNCTKRYAGLQLCMACKCFLLDILPV